MIPAHIAHWAQTKRNKSNEEARVAVVATQLTTVAKKHKKKDVAPVLQSKGGGGYQPPPQPSPQEQAAAREWEAAQAFEREERRAAREKAVRDEEKRIADAAWQSGKGAAYNSALQSGTSRLRGMGIEAGDPYGVYSDFTGRLGGTNAALQTGADYSSAFSPTILDEILGSARTGQRTKYGTQFGQQINPYYAEDQFSGTSDDAILSAILDQQYNDAFADLGAARDRGQASSIVYDRALRDLGTARSTANTELQGIGRGVLEDITGDINQRRQSSLDSAAAWDFGSTYDPTAEANRIRGYADERRGQLEGDIRGAVGGREFFDVNSLLGKATARAGNQTTPTTQGTSALYDTFENEAQRNNNSTRANEGTF